MKNALRWTLSLTFLAFVGVSCQQATDTPTAPSTPTGQADDGDGTVTAMAGPSTGGGAGPSGGGGAGPTTGGAGPGTTGTTPGGGGGSGGGGGGLPGGGGATPTPTPGFPTPTPTPDPLEVTGLTVATGAPYEVIVNDTDCCSNSMGPAWLDYPYVLQRNFGASPPIDPLIMIRTAIADTNASDDPLITFNVNRCARVSVILEPFVSNDANIPEWLVTGGFQCTSTVSTFYHETFGSSDQTSGRRCSKDVSPGSVQLGPRDPVGFDDHMYTVFVSSGTLIDCP